MKSVDLFISLNLSNEDICNQKPRENKKYVNAHIPILDWVQFGDVQDTVKEFVICDNPIMTIENP